jgi:Cys-tRNA(Pro)/Cys-tRNA(Cys) deacylase
MNGPEPPNGTPALLAIRARGTAHRVVITEPAGSAEESASMQGIPLGALLRTIVVRRGEDDYLFVLVPAGRRFDWPKLRAHLGVSRMSLPDADEAQRVTGYVRYTITPFGSTRPWPVLADAAILDQPIVAIVARGASTCISRRRTSSRPSPPRSSTCRCPTRPDRRANACIST